MGIALINFSGLCQSLAQFTRLVPIAPKPTRPQAGMHPVWATRKPACAPQALKGAKPQAHVQSPSKVPALRVLRVTENGQRTMGAGRMVISGRMADVCAELDRLAALEAAQARV